MFCRVKKIQNKNNTIRYNFYICHRYRNKWLYEYVLSKDIFIFSLKSDEDKKINYEELKKLIEEKLSEVTEEFNSEELTAKMIYLIDTTTKNVVVSK